MTPDTSHLEDPLSGQDVEGTIRQYKTDRDPREPLFAHGRCLAHFAEGREATVDHVQGERRAIEQLAEKAKEAIDRLKEFRTALIFAAVTGKIDVREEVAT